MFTGIIEEMGRVILAGGGNLAIAAGNILRGMQIGGSIGVNGVCLTITNLDSKSFSVEVMPETAKRTNLGFLKIGQKVNIERPLSLGGQLGGHLVQGHIDDIGEITSITWEGGANLIRFKAPSQVMRYIVEKGFIAVDGISLTVVNKDTSSFQVSVVDYTYRHTTLGEQRVGDSVNLEVDILAKYVEQFIQTSRTGITIDFLREYGFAEN